MKVYTNIIDVKDGLSNGALAIGNFDGVHLGHQAILSALCNNYPKKKRGVLSFFPHPREILRNDDKFFYLTNEEEKIELIKKWPIDILIQHRIDKVFLSLSAKDFVIQLLKEKLKISHILVGKDFCFGKDKIGNVDYLANISKNIGIDLDVIDDFTIDGIRCSSSYIRELFKKGEIKKASKFLAKG